MNRGRKVVPPPLGNGFNSKLIMLKDRQELPARPESDGLYWILSGAIQTSIISEDGRRWIGGFYLPGEFILLERDEVRSQFAQALCPTSLIMTDRSVLEGLSQFDHFTCATITTWFLRTYRVALRTGFLLGRSNAMERLAFFLLDLMQRLEGRRHFHLLMSRADIGDHLGLTSETVTRTFTRLQRHNYVQVNGRNLEILDPIGLARLAAAVVTT
ncbi:bacterial regulatory s, crp family protein [Sphingomonas sp. S17]|jgi:CRP/FNR family nitrogen fixation transcriptional regulator|uniref:DNA, contig: SP643 n=3 Tax=Sphingomonas TaxID=13687 RepID=A0A0C9MVQ4_SPHPI|nr:MULTISPECIES: helix-turn-helix domain-containing protein [Sphingomonas]GAN14706.1 putative Crp family transcriptional regulator [Sphingomonas paucimobilis NBRC 13935]EGI54089.1 bacterial regulatory s, crp family protein [Sphingomonas sp. S17]MCM3681125.1 helix-turn-helix domain-containing protein [Sphingomonas paucimobilis]NJB99950.1 CRP/FNR family nitrogen fixation transcriptional regulator [Sphingomonas trueperi]SUK02695.1 Fumarate and nitrate reduction regulatory protein [Sphingomonas pa